MEPLYILILAIVGLFTASLTILKIVSMRRESSAGNNGGNLKAKVISIEGLIAQKRDKALCDERHAHVLRDLAKGQEQFEAILNVQSHQADMLSRIDERVEFLAEQSGYGKRKK